MSSLTGNLISSTYPSLLKIGTNNTASANLNNITDGVGNSTSLFVSTEGTAISGSFTVSGSTILSGSTTVIGTLAATSSNAVSASYSVSSSYALTASFARSASLAASSSYAVSASNANFLDGLDSTAFLTSSGSNTFIGDQIISGSIIPGGLAYDLGTIDAPWKELYVSTGSINFVNNGTVVSSMGVGTSGTQITGSLVVSSSIVLQPGGGKSSNITAWREGTNNGLLISSTGSISIYSTGSAAVLGLGVNLKPPTGYPQVADVTVAINTAYVNYGAGSVTIGGPKDGSRGGLLAFRSFYDNTEWTISQTTNSSNNLIIQVNGYPDLQQNQILFKPVDYGTNTYNIKFNVNGIVPETDSGNFYDLGTESATWQNTYTDNLALTPQTEPSSPVAGQIYFNTSDFHFYGFNGTIWKQLDN